MNIRHLVKKNVLLLHAYNAQEIPCRIKLDSNESPYGFTKSLKNISGIHTNRYPDPEAKALKKIIAKDLRVKPENILHGNGSDEFIYYLITTFGGPVLYPVPTFSMYGIISRSLGEKIVEVPLDTAFDLDLQKILRHIKKQNPKIIFLSRPNNPTGNSFSERKIRAIIHATKGIVVVDEAYQPFSAESGFLPFIKTCKNLIIMRTLSKIGLAGLRLGFLITHADIIREVNKVRLPYNVNALSQAVAIEALKDRKSLRAAVIKIVAERKKLFAAMEKIQTITPYPSEANFILFKTGNAVSVYSALMKKGVLVKNINDIMKGCLRVTVGTPGENAFFLKTLKEVTAGIR
jgi:histidinol-phosphate aminotransferase